MTQCEQDSKDLNKKHSQPPAQKNNKNNNKTRARNTQNLYTF